MKPLKLIAAAALIVTWITLIAACTLARQWPAVVSLLCLSWIVNQCVAFYRNRDRVERIGNRVYLDVQAALRANGSDEYQVALGAMAASKAAMRELED